MPRVGEAIDYFFDNVFFPGDNLVVKTPMKTYNLKGRALETKSREEIANQLRGILRRDATIGNSEYRAVLKELREIVKIIEARDEGEKETSREIEDSSPDLYDAASLEEVVGMYSSVMAKLENLRRMDQQKVLDFAKFLKNKEGQLVGIGTEPGRILKIGFEWGGMTKEMRSAIMKKRAASSKVSDRKAGISGDVTRERDGVTGSNTMAIRRPKKYSFWVEVKLAKNQ